MAKDMARRQSLQLKRNGLTMAKLAIGLGLYAIAFAAFYAATSIAPDMTWPRTNAEFMAAQLLAIGALAKCGGLVALLSAANAR